MASSSSPLIGITTSYASDEQQLDVRYVRAIERAGGVPLLLPTTTVPATVQRLVTIIDGLLIPGGPAVTEGLVGEVPDDLGALDPARRAADAAYLDAVWDTDRPILGICYGMQCINARQGGTIYGDVQARRPGAQAHSQKRGATSHDVRIERGTHLHRILGRDAVEVNTRHLQALASVGDGLQVSATAPDGVIEAIEDETGRILGLQFHPERMGTPMHPLFKAFVAHAARRPAPA